MHKQIEALLVERAGYVARNLKDRIAAVDVSLRELGYEHKYLTPPVELAATAADLETAANPKRTKRVSN